MGYIISHYLKSVIAEPVPHLPTDRISQKKIYNRINKKLICKLFPEVLLNKQTALKKISWTLLYVQEII